MIQIRCVLLFSEFTPEISQVVIVYFNDWFSVLSDAVFVSISVCVCGSVINYPVRSLTLARC